MKKFQATLTKQDLCTSKVFFKISDEQARAFNMGVPPPPSFNYTDNETDVAIFVINRMYHDFREHYHSAKAKISKSTLPRTRNRSH